MRTKKRCGVYQSKGGLAEQRQEWSHETAATRVSADPLGSSGVGDVKTGGQVLCPSNHSCGTDCPWRGGVNLGENYVV